MTAHWPWGSWPDPVSSAATISPSPQLQRKHTAHVFRDLPDLIYKMLSQVGPLRLRQEREIQDMRATAMAPEWAHHLMVEAVRHSILPASRLPKVLQAWESPRHDEFRSRSAWSLFNAITEVLKEGSPRMQMEGSLRLSALFRKELLLR